MEKITSAVKLRERILELENRKLEEKNLLREQFNLTYESFKPLNLLKNAINSVSSSHELKDNFLGSVVGVATGYLSKLMFVGVSRNPVRKLFGSLVMMGITNLVAKNPEKVKTFGFMVVSLIKRIRDAHKSQKEAKQEYPTI